MAKNKYTHKICKSKQEFEEIKRKLAKRTILQNDFLSFARYFFEVLENTGMWVNWHHYWFAHICNEVYKGNLTNVLINVSPGSSKTLVYSVLFPLWCYARNPRCRFICTSFSDDLIKDSSMKIKDLIESKEFQELFPGIGFKADTNSKSKWILVDTNTKRSIGEYFASTLFGKLTGFRAGYPTEDNSFTGAIIVDDPLKPDDAFSEANRLRTNRFMSNTLFSRVMKKGVTPIIVIMQRLHSDDPSGFIMDGGTGMEWKTLKLPALIDKDYIETLPEFVKSKAQEYYDLEVKLETLKYVINHLKKILKNHEEVKETREFKDISLTDLKNLLQKYISDDFIDKEIRSAIKKFREEFDGFVSYWSKKEPLEELKKVEGSDSYTFQTQYMQEAVAIGGNLFKENWWIEEEHMPFDYDYIRITADTAQKTGEHNDFTVFLCYGVKNNDIYVIALKRGKWEAPDLIKKAEKFYNKAYSLFGSKLQSFYIEDKVSGTGLIQTLKKETRIPIIAVQRTKDKVSRVMASLKYVESGRVHIPKKVKWKMQFLKEMGEFSELGNAKHDDIVDCMVTALEIEYVKSNKAKVKPLEMW